MNFQMLILVAGLIIAPHHQGRDTVETHFKNAVEAFNAHDDSGEAMDEAEKEFALVLKLNPRHAPARAYQGLIALEKQKLVLAEAAFHDALAIDAKCPEAHVGRVRLLRARSMWAESYRESRLTVELAPTNKMALWELVTVLLNRVEAPVTDVERKEAEPLLKKILAINPDERQAHLDLADMYNEQRRWAEAVAHYKEVLRIGQTDEDMDVWVYEVNKTVSECYEKMGDYQHALEFLKTYRDVRKEYGADDTELKETNEKISELQRKANRN